MGVHTYCIVPAGTAASGRGLEDQPLHALQTRMLAAWFTEHEQQPAATVESLRRHDAVIRSACSERTTPVPLRFGQWFEERTQLQQRMHQQQAEWLERLREFAGCIEYGLRIVPLEPRAVPAEPEPASLPAEGPGRAYLQQLAARSHACELEAAAKADVLREVAALTSPCVLREASGDTPEAGGAVWVAHLVRRSNVETYREAIAALHERLPGYRVVATGPWPPYSFAAS